MADTTYEPLSGAVTLPWTWWVRSLGQFGLININETKSGDPALEQKIVHDVASYGRQLGQISDALSTLLRHTEHVGWSDDDEKTLKKFTDMVAQIDALKQRDDAKAQAAQIDRLVDAVEALKRSDRPTYDALAKRLRSVVG